MSPARETSAAPGPTTANAPRWRLSTVSPRHTSARTGLTRALFMKDRGKKGRKLSARQHGAPELRRRGNIVNRPEELRHGPGPAKALGGGAARSARLPRLPLVEDRHADGVRRRTRPGAAPVRGRAA